MTMLSKAEMLKNMQAFDIDAEQLAKEKISDEQFMRVYFAIMPAQLKVIHLDEPAEAHAMMADYFEMLACPFCRAHMFPTPPDAREEGVEA